MVEQGNIISEDLNKSFGPISDRPQPFTKAGDSDVGLHLIYHKIRIPVIICLLC